MTHQIEKIRVGMIGVGGIAQGHVQRLLALPEVEIVALADASEKSIENTQERHGEGVAQAQTFADYRELLEKAKPDAVVICTPHTQHFQQAVDSLDAGAHVLLEKPMVNRVDGRPRTAHRRLTRPRRSSGWRTSATPTGGSATSATPSRRASSARCSSSTPCSSRAGRRGRWGRGGRTRRCRAAGRSTTAARTCWTSSCGRRASRPTRSPPSWTTGGRRWTSTRP